MRTLMPMTGDRGAVTRAGAALAQARWAATAYDRCGRRADELIRDWPMLSDEQRANLRSRLAPLLNDSEANL